MTSKNLDILQIVPYYYPAWAYGGIPRVVYELSTELVRRGHRVTVFTTDVLDRDERSPYSGTEADINGVRVRYFKNLSNRLAYDRQLYLPMGMKKAVCEEIADHDIVHCHGHRNILNNIVWSAALRFQKKYILSAHGTVIRIERRVFAKKIFDAVYGRRILRDADHFIAVSEKEMEQYMAMHVGPDRVSVVYNGIDVNAFRNLPPRGMFRREHGLEGKEIILFLGKITPRKGVDFLVRAYSMLNRDNAVLVIAGNDMGFKKKVDRLAGKRELAGRIVYTGLLGDVWKKAAYRDADVVVYPSVYEVFGLVPFEALLCESPVIVADDCGCGEIIRREGIGEVVRYNDDEGLCRAIEVDLENRQYARKTAGKGKIFVQQTLSWERIAAQYENVYASRLF